MSGTAKGWKCCGCGKVSPDGKKPCECITICAYSPTEPGSQWWDDCNPYEEAETIASLRAELEAVKRERDEALTLLDKQIAGHRLTARDATDNLIRAQAAEARADKLAVQLAVIVEQAEVFKRAVQDCDGAKLPSYLTTAQLRNLCDAIGDDEAELHLWQRWEAACGVLSDYYSEVAMYETEHETQPAVVNPGTRHRADAVLADNPKWAKGVFGLYESLEARANKAEKERDALRSENGKLRAQVILYVNEVNELEGDSK